MGVLNTGKLTDTLFAQADFVTWILMGRKDEERVMQARRSRAVYLWQALEVVGALRCGVGWQKCHFVECLREKLLLQACDKLRR